MSRITPVSWRRLRCVFQRDGFVFVKRTDGSHWNGEKRGIKRPIVIPEYDEIGLDIIRANMRTARALFQPAATVLSGSGACRCARPAGFNHERQRDRQLDIGFAKGRFRRMSFGNRYEARVLRHFVERAALVATDQERGECIDKVAPGFVARMPLRVDV